LCVLSSDIDYRVREKAAEALTGSVRSLVFQGYAAQAREGTAGLSPELRPVLRAELREFVLLNNSEYTPGAAEEKSQRATIVYEWIEELKSNNIHDRLVEDVGAESWDYHLEQKEWESRTRDLATHLLQHTEELDRELPWLNSSKARSSFEFGTQLGRWMNR
jgi:hypothetical protein